MKKLLLAGMILLIVPSVSDAQRRGGGVHRSTTTMHRGGTTIHRSTTSVHRGGYAHRPVAGHRVYHPGPWHGRVIHAGPFHYPHGYAYRRWAVGHVLPRVFLAPAYYYPGYAALGLMAPPPDYQWIRYGPDLLLVDLATGNVVDIRYGVFD